MKPIIVVLSNDHVEEIYEIREFMIESVPQRLKIEELVERSSMSKTRLTRGFEFLFQITIHQYWLEISMAYAVGKLREGASAKEIAISLGYQTTKSFSRAFKNYYGFNATAIKSQ